MKLLVATLVLAAVAAAAAAAAIGGDRIPLRGVDTGTFRYDPTSNPAVVHTHDVMSGTLTHLGRFTATASEDVNLNTFVATNGEFTFTAANGDTVYGRYTAQAFPTDDPAQITYVATGPISGGTGRFAGVTGAITFNGWANFATGELGDELSGWISNGGGR